MTKTVCGCNCEECGGMSSGCKGCTAISDNCIVALCCKNLGHKGCEECHGECELKGRLINEFNSGDYINLEYTLPSGQRTKLLDDSKIYLGNQMCKIGSDRCYGLAADRNFLLVCEYGEQGADAEIVVFKRRKLSK